jgi:hypothetical protein
VSVCVCVREGRFSDNQEVTNRSCGGACAASSASLVMEEGVTDRETWFGLL